MYKVELYARVRRACMVEGMSTREAARVFGLHWDTVRKMLEYSVPPGYRRQSPPRRPELDPYHGVIDRILEEDLRLPKKQRHTAKRIYDRLRAEHGFGGRYTIVKDYVRERRRRTREMYVPLSHPPGHAQCDFGQAKAVIGGMEQTIHYFVLDLPHSNACFVKAYPAETTEAFCDGHVSAFSFLGGVPRSILYDNTRLAVARILGDGRRQRTRVFSELQFHYLFEDRFGRPASASLASTRLLRFQRTADVCGQRLSKSDILLETTLSSWPRMVWLSARRFTVTKRNSCPCMCQGRREIRPCGGAKVKLSQKSVLSPRC